MSEMEIMDAVDMAIKDRGLKQYQVADKLDCRQGQVSMWMTRQRGITLFNLIRLLDAVGLEIRIQKKGARA